GCWRPPGGWEPPGELLGGPAASGPGVVTRDSIRAPARSRCPVHSRDPDVRHPRRCSGVVRNGMWKSAAMTDVRLGRDWLDILERLDRDAASGQLSPDTAALPDLMGT